MSSNIFNKHLPEGKGTLDGNWYEERALRDFTGVGRTIIREHIPKRCGNLEEPIYNDKKFDNTLDRIHGVRRDEIMQSENYMYGRSKNPADELPQVGKRTMLMEREIQQKVLQELAEKEREEERQRNMRYFDTTGKTTFVEQDMTANVVGRKVMKTQDGGLVAMDNRDELLMVEHGFGRRTQKTTDQELVNQIPQGHYTQT